MNYECLICQVKSLQQRLEKYEIPEEKRDHVAGELLKEIASIDLENSFSPEITRNLLGRLKNYSTVEDPYRKEKQEGNRLMLERYNEFREIVRNSKNPFDTALRLAIAGNIIDFGPTNHFDVDGTIEKVLNSAFAIDHSKMLEHVANIISNSDDALSTLLHRVSPEFQKIYQQAGLIISKGMGN